jgi:hypothetical protein
VNLATSHVVAKGHSVGQRVGEARESADTDSAGEEREDRDGDTGGQRPEPVLEVLRETRSCLGPSGGRTPGHRYGEAEQDPGYRGVDAGRVPQHPGRDGQRQQQPPGVDPALDRQGEQPERDQRCQQR